jgi:hypothetical protein
MRNRKFLVGAGLTVVSLFAMVGVAQAAQTQTMTAAATNTKQDKKVPGGTGLHVDIKTTFPLGTPAAQGPNHTDLDLPRDFSFVPPVATCNPTQLQGTTTAAALGLCGPSQVGQGVATLCSPLGGCAATPGGGVPAVVTAFNGVPSGGSPQLILHTKPGGVAAATPPTILTGVLIPSPAGGQFGQRLSVTVPDTSSTGFDLVDFDTTINRIQTRKANKKKGKPAKFYINAKCSSRTWAFQETTTFNAGGGTATASASQPCTQKKTKKKK